MNILNLPNFKVISLQENQYDYQITVETTSPPLACHKCGCVANLHGFGKKDQLYMDFPMHGKRVGLIVVRKRYRCKECLATFFELLEDMDDKRFMTKRLITYIEKQSLSKTFVGLAEDIGVDEKTIRNIFREHIDLLESQRQIVIPRWLGIDEIHLLGKPRCVITDVENRFIIDLLRNRNKEPLIQYLLRLPNRDKVEYVTMDMWQPYRDACYTAFPKARIIVDKFHIVRMANKALEALRLSNRAGLKTKERRQLMRDRFILLKRNHKLDDRDRIILESWTGTFDNLRIAYALKEEFFDIFDSAQTRQEAEERYDKWVQTISETMITHFQPIITALTNWRTEVFNYFDHPDRITNAYTESLNSVIRVVNRSGRGYSFEALRAKMLFSEGITKNKKPKFRRPIKLKNAIDLKFLKTIKVDPKASIFMQQMAGRMYRISTQKDQSLEKD